MTPFRVQQQRGVTMEEKIKISLAKETLELLRKDCEDFKITKQNGQINFNSFINLLIYNYFESFTAKEETLYDNIRDAISIIPNYYQEKVFGNIAKLFAKQSYFVADKHSTTTFSFKPTKISEKAITYTACIANGNASVLSHFARQIISGLFQFKHLSAFFAPLAIVCALKNLFCETGSKFLRRQEVQFLHS